MDFPITCGSCKKENWIDLGNPQTWQLNSLVVIEGYICQFCEERIPFFYYTRSMEDALKSLKYSNPTQSSFRYRFYKTLRKAIGIREKYHG